MLKRCLLFLLLIACGVCMAMGEEPQEGVIVSNTNEFLAALENSAVTEIIFKTSIVTKTALTVNKAIDLNGNNWNIDSKTVSVTGSVSGGKIIVGKNATLLAYIEPSATKEVKGTMRVMKQFSVDCASGMVDSVSYKGSSGKDSGNGIKGALVTKGSVSLMVKTGKNGEAKEVSYIKIDDVKYKAGTKINAYSKTYKIKLIITEEETQIIEYTALDAAITLGDKVRNGFIFEGWIAEGSETPEKTKVIPEGSTGNMTFTAAWTEDPNAKPEEFPKWNGGGGGHGYSGFSGRMGGGDEAALLDETGVVEEEEEASEGSEEAENTPPEPDQPGSQNRPKRVSVASERTKTAFETGAPKTEDVGVTIEADPKEKLRLYAIGGGTVLAAIVLLALLGRSKRR